MASAAKVQYLKSGDINREKTCPLLLKVYYKTGSHHRVEEFEGKSRDSGVGLNEVQIYTWRDATLRELTDLVKSVYTAERQRPSRLSFAFVYPDKSGRLVMRQVGQTYWNPSSKGGDKDDSKTLDELRFETGDLLDLI